MKSLRDPTIVVGLFRDLEVRVIVIIVSCTLAFPPDLESSS